MLKLLKLPSNYFKGKYWLPKSTQEDIESLNKSKVINQMEKTDKEFPLRMLGLDSLICELLKKYVSY